MGRILKNLKSKDWICVAICVILIFGQVYLDLKLPDYISDVTQLIMTEGTAMSQVWLAGGKMLLCALLSAVLAGIVGYFASKIASDFSYTVRSKVFNKISDFGVFEIKKFSTPSLITRTTNDITQIQMFIAMGLQMLMKAPILATWAVIKIFGKSWQLSVVVMCAVLILIVTICLVIMFVMPKFKIIQKQVDDINRVTEESLTGVKVVRAFNADEYQAEKFEDVNDKLTKTNLFSMRVLSILQPILTLVMSGLPLAIYYVGSSLINGAVVTERVAMLGEVMSFSSYGTYVVMSFMMLAMIFMIFPRAQVSAKRICEVLDQKTEVVEGTENFDDKNLGLVEFKNVSFKYPNGQDYILKDINFTATKGQTIAIIGTSGSGKTTLANLIARLYDASDGEILIDGEDIKKYTFASLYSKVAYVAQKAIVFSDTVLNNVSFGSTNKQVLNEDIEKAIEIAQAKNFVENMQEGYNSEIAQGGINISGGQKQRLSIARAIARKPEILIFDDSFSALDFKTDKKLRQEIDKNLKDTTCFIVANRIGTIKSADQILVLDDGKLVGKGTHSELMSNCEVYREIALSQLSAQELKD